MRYICIVVLAVAMEAWCSAQASPPATRPAAMQARVDALLKQLGADAWEDRQAAQDELIKLGEDVAPDLRRLQQTTNDEEVRTRAELALREISWTPDRIAASIRELQGTITYDSNSPARPIVSVFLHGKNVTDADVRHLAGLSRLQSLDLGATHVTDAGVQYIQRMTSLQWLILAGAPITDAGVEDLRGLTGLQSLNLWGTQITDAGLEHLKGLAALQTLDLRDTAVTDAGLAYLKGLKGLEMLELAGTKVTDAGVKTLQQQLPKATICR